MLFIGIVLFYLIGVVLAYGRLLASFAQIDADFPMLTPLQPSPGIKYVSLLSWFAVLTGIIVYFIDESGPHRQFFRFTMKDIWETHNNNEEAQRYKKLGLQ